MPLNADTAVQTLEGLSRSLRRLAGEGGYHEEVDWFGPDEPRPGDAGFAERFEEPNRDFPSWIDPGEVAAPPPDRIELREGLLRFPSARPCGRPEIDEVALKLFPVPAGAPATGVLFHHWVYMDGWLAADLLLRPLTRRYRVAAMVAPHHIMRRPPEIAAGEGMLNPNPRHIFEGFRQWLADHQVCLKLLRRDHGFERVVVLGYSMGAYFTLLGRLCAAAVPTVTVSCTNNYARGVFHGEHTATLRDLVVEAGFTRASFARVTRAFHLARWADRIGGEQLTLIRARHDHMEPADSQRELLHELEPERAATVPGGHSTAIFNRRRICEEVIRRVEEGGGRSGTS